MTRKEFTANCKSNGVNIKSITTHKGKTTILYNYDLPDNTLSETYTRTHYNSSLQEIHDTTFAYLFGIIKL